ncbi:MAG: CehA/McbA family metallohydrolase [Opitutaceae bacterium]
MRFGLLFSPGFLAAVALSAPAPDRYGTLKVSIVDQISNLPTPARVELLDAKNEAFIAEDALGVGTNYQDLKTSWQDTPEQEKARLSKTVFNSNAGTKQFYSTGTFIASVPAGTYRLRTWKGPEYTPAARELTIAPNGSTELTLTMSRWIDMPAQGWYGADDHLHISRPFKELDPLISKWMQAEDIHVANMLGFSHSRHLPGVYNTPQHSFGEPGAYQEGNYILLSSQENPRTHLLGHAIVLGAKSYLNFPDNYLLYGQVFAEARRQGAVSGYAHYGSRMGAAFGLAIDLPDDNLNFIEIIQFNDGIYDVWYDILNAGLRLAPTAGTDYPVGDATRASLPGRERFYTQVEGPLTCDRWLEGIRRGRTFATNGPMLEFRINGKSMGAEIALKHPGTVEIEGRVRFDPARDEVNRIEIVENGLLVRSFPREGGSAEIRCRFQHTVQESGWLALRSIGRKVGDRKVFLMRYDLTTQPSLAHSAPVYITLQNVPRRASPWGRRSLQPWIARLDDLKERLSDDRLKDLARAGPDGVSLEILQKNRQRLLEAIERARQQYLSRERSAQP